MRATAFALLLSLTAGPAAAAVVTVQNRTAQPITFVVLHGERRQAVTLAPADTAVVPVGRDAQLVVTRDRKNERFALDPWTPYLFVPAGNSFDFQGVKLAAELPKPDDVPAVPLDRKPVPVPVTLHVDDRDGRTKAVWGKALRERFAAAVAPLEGPLGVKFDIADAWEWKATAEPGWDFALEHFRTSVEAKAGGLAVGFLAKPMAKSDGEQFFAAGRPWRSHLLVLDGYPRTEAERVDALAHALARQLGAVRTGDGASVMRERLFDGQATKPSYRPRLDPLNLLAMSVWVEEKAGGHKLTWDDLRPKARARLLAVYKTMAELPSKDPTATEYVEALVSGKDVVLPAQPTTPDPARKLGDRDAAVWAVVKAVSDTAKKLADDPKRPKGDELTIAYVRAAATAADGQPAEHAAPAFLIGLGLALDDSTVLRANPLTKRMCERVETDDERKGRLAALGTPTVRGRRDLCQHFAVSVALVQLVGPEAAEFAGLTKELNDMKGASGFSFVDLSADYAGVAFARAVTTDAKLLARLKDGFAVSDWVPAFDGLREGLPEGKFQDLFGGTGDARFKAVVTDIRKRVAELPGHKR